MGLGGTGGGGAAAGLHVSRIDGSPMVYNERDPWLPDLLVCRPEFAEPALDATQQPATGLAVTVVDFPECPTAPSAPVARTIRP